MAGRRRGRYPLEYKERVDELVRAGRTPVVQRLKRDVERLRMERTC